MAITASVVAGVAYLLLDVSGSLVLAAALVLVARSIAVAVTVPWFGFKPRILAFVSWAGLRGGVPIVLATFPLTAGYPDAQLVFDVVFFVVLVSVAVEAPRSAPWPDGSGSPPTQSPPPRSSWASTTCTRT